MPGPEVREALDALDLTVHDFATKMALAFADLRRAVPRKLGIGDRA